MPQQRDTHQNRLNRYTANGVIAFMFVTLVGAVGVAGGNWEREKISDDGIELYTRSTPGTTVREVRAKVTIAAPPEVVLDAACDPDSYKGTTKKYVKKNHFYHVKDPNVWYNYQLVDFPMVTKRDYTMRYEKKMDVEKGVYQLEWHVSDRFGPPPQDDVVRVTLVKGFIDIKPMKDGENSLMRYTLLADPGGNIPDWIINLANRKSMPNILREIRDSALKRVKK
ncbi:MAG: hypothetical protein JXX29_04385 [Deltaproteobacteria bacterium]|nr:hypothetical protein [Deltaproteobacteria bacterium]MBN2670882.1 hypothetical protein [Deltaproteobacteria bacterium]